MVFGIKASKEGFDVGTADPKDLVFSSEYDTFRVSSSGTGSITASTALPTTLTIPHALGYRPAFSFYTQIYDPVAGSVTTGYSLCPYSDPVGGDASIQPYCSTADIKVRYGKDHAPNGTILGYKFFIYHNLAY